MPTCWNCKYFLLFLFCFSLLFFLFVHYFMFLPLFHSLWHSPLLINQNPSFWKKIPYFWCLNFQLIFLAAGLVKGQSIHPQGSSDANVIKQKPLEQLLAVKNVGKGFHIILSHVGWLYSGFLFDHFPIKEIFTLVLSTMFWLIKKFCLPILEIVLKLFGYFTLDFQNHQWITTKD